MSSPPSSSTSTPPLRVRRGPQTSISTPTTDASATRARRRGTAPLNEKGARYAAALHSYFSAKKESMLQDAMQFSRLHIWTSSESSCRETSYGAGGSGLGHEDWAKVSMCARVYASLCKTRTVSLLQHELDTWHPPSSPLPSSLRLSPRITTYTPGYVFSATYVSQAPPCGTETSLSNNKRTVTAKAEMSQGYVANLPMQRGVPGV